MTDMCMTARPLGRRHETSGFSISGRRQTDSPPASPSTLAGVPAARPPAERLAAAAEGVPGGVSPGALAAPPRLRGCLAAGGAASGGSPAAGPAAAAPSTPRCPCSELARSEGPAPCGLGPAAMLGAPAAAASCCGGQAMQI